MKKYVIREGDTMYTISKKTGVRLPLLLASNPHVTNPATLMPGTTIVVPELGKPAKNHLNAAKQAQMQKEKKTTSKHSGAPEYFGFVWPHVVMQNENLNAITKRYGITSEQIRRLNPRLNLEQPLRPGTILYIPFTSVPEAMKSPPKEAVPVEPVNTIGSHTHAPHRQTKSASDFRYQVPPGWDGDVDESSSLLSSWDEWDNATIPHTRNRITATSEDGWSDIFTIHVDEDD